MDDQKLRQPPPSIPYCARPRSRGIARQQRLHLLSHPPIWTTIYTRSSSLPHQCRCPCNRQRLFLSHFSLLFIASYHRSPTYCSRALPWRTMSSSSNSNMVIRHRRFIFSRLNQRSPLLQSLPAPVSCSLVGINSFLHVSAPFCFIKGVDQGNVASTPPHLRGHWDSSHGVRTLGIYAAQLYEQLISDLLAVGKG